MSTVIFLLVCLTLMLSVALFYAIQRMNEMGQEVIGYEHSDHAKCIAHVAHYVGNQHAALVLRDAAKDYDSVKGQAEAEHLMENPNWRSGSHSLPALWLEQRADQIDLDSLEMHA